MTVLWSPESRKELKRLSAQVRDRIIDKTEDFHRDGRGDIRRIAEGLWRLRVGDYRVYYHPEEGKIYVLRVTHRRHAYREDLISALREEIGRL